MALLNLLLHLLLLTTTVTARNSTYCSEVERQALLAIKTGLSHAAATRLSSWKGFACCSWTGVSCTAGHVVKLDLRNSFYPRTVISPSLLHLTHLQYLDLSLNYFGSPIPTFIGSLTHLSYLNLAGAGFYGPIPQHLGNLTRLISLDLSLNSDFTGTRSLTADSLTWLSALRSLQYLDMGGADLSNATNWLNILTTRPSLSVLSLHDCQLSGNLVTLGHFNLTSLTVLDISGNHLGGTIPTTIGNLTSLTVLDLYQNYLGGTIHATIGNLTNLQSLDLSGNNFTGIIPDTLGNLCNLTYLDISVNNFYGMSEFMEGLSQCNPARLQYLDMSNNMLTGYLPEHVGGIQSLQVLDLGNNMFNGSIPSSIGRISALNEISLGSNSFTGEVTEAHLSNLVNLEVLDLSYNSLIVNVSESWLPPFKAKDIFLSSCKLGPKFPTWLRNQTSLYNLDLSGASISDMIPSWFVELLPALNDLDLNLNLSSNQLNGEFPRTMNFIYIETLDLSHNKFEGLLPKLDASFIDISYNNFSGPISKFLSGMEQLPSVLILSHNRLNGSISPSICATNSMVVADLSYNEFSEELLDCWDNSSSTLEIVNFSNNRLSGKIPSSMGNLNQLESLHLSDNRLTGEIPLSLQNFTKLVTLDLGNNNLQGNIPSWIGSCLRMLKVLRLRSNVLHGNIPVQLSLLASLQVLDLGNNSLSGVLPPWLGNLTALQTINHNMSALYSLRDGDNYYHENLFVYTKGNDYEYTNTLSLVKSIDISSNKLTGEIPDELTKLRGLIFLNLSDNHLRGGIPIGIGQLEELESLDMSMNELSGSIPRSITSLYSLGTLRLSNNNLAGPIPLGGQMSTFSESSFSNNVNLCGPPLPKKCSNDKPSDEGVEEDEDDDGDGDDDDSETIWNLIIGFAPGLVVGFWTFIGVTMIKSSTRYAYFQFIDRIINLCM